MEVSIGYDRGQEPSNRECPDHIGAVGTYGLTTVWTEKEPILLPHTILYWCGFK